MLSSTFWVLEVCDCSEIGERNLLEKSLFCMAFVKREEIGPKDKMERLPLLGVDGQ